MEDTNNRKTEITEIISENQFIFFEKVIELFFEANKIRKQNTDSINGHHRFGSAFWFEKKNQTTKKKWIIRFETRPLEAEINSEKIASIFGSLKMNGFLFYTTLIQILKLAKKGKVWLGMKLDEKHVLKVSWNAPSKCSPFISISRGLSFSNSRILQWKIWI